jgi:hypothetical protein
LQRASYVGALDVRNPSLDVRACLHNAVYDWPIIIDDRLKGRSFPIFGQITQIGMMFRAH